VLGSPEEDVAGRASNQACLEAAVTVEQGERAAFVGKGVDESGTEQDIAEHCDAAEVDKGNAEVRLALMIYTNSLVVEMGVGALF